MQISRRAFSLSMAAATCCGAPARAADPEPFVSSHPLYTASVDLLARERWSDLVSSVAALPPQSAFTLLTDLGDGSPLVGDLKGLARVNGGAGVAGAIQVGWAWRLRGSTEKVVDENGFARHLVAAGEMLIRAQQHDHNDGVTVGFLFRVLKGAGETEALHALLPAYLSAERRPVEGLAHYADAVSAKWLGSETEALTFARHYAGSAPAASFGLVPDTHITAAVARQMSDDASVKASAPAYFESPDVNTEILAANGRFLAAPVDADPFAAVLAHAQFSMAFLQMNDVEHTRQHLIAQGMSAVGPWRYLENPTAALARVRSALRLNLTAGVDDRGINAVGHSKFASAGVTEPQLGS